MLFIAEEVDAVDTMLTTKNEDGIPGNINWFGLQTYMLKEMQYMKHTIDTLVEENATMKTTIATLSNQIEALQNP